MLPILTIKFLNFLSISQLPKFSSFSDMRNIDYGGVYCFP